MNQCRSISIFTLILLPLSLGLKPKTEKVQINIYAIIGFMVEQRDQQHISAYATYNIHYLEKHMAQ